MGCACGAQDKTKNGRKKYKSLSGQLKDLGLQIKNIDSDGNCLFRAISHQLENTESNHLFYRKAACEYMKEHKENFIPFLDEGITFEKYVHRMSFSGVWGGNLEIYAISKKFLIEVHIHMLNQPIYTIKCDKPKKTIELAYLEKEHYGSVIKNPKSGKALTNCTNINSTENIYKDNNHNKAHLDI